MESANDEIIRETDSDLQELRDVSPDYDTYIRLTKTEIPALECEIQDHQHTNEDLLGQYSKVVLYIPA
jgi:DNA repair protein RAD50